MRPAEAERYYLGSNQEGVLAWSRIELATILQKQGKPDQAMTKLDQAAAWSRACRWGAFPRKKQPPAN